MKTTVKKTGRVKKAAKEAGRVNGSGRKARVYEGVGIAVEAIVLSAFCLFMITHQIRWLALAAALTACVLLFG